MFWGSKIVVNETYLERYEDRERDRLLQSRNRQEKKWRQTRYSFRRKHGLEEQAPEPKLKLLNHSKLHIKLTVALIYSNGRNNMTNTKPVDKFRGRNLFVSLLLFWDALSI